jgi:hypothetical protein
MPRFLDFCLRAQQYSEPVRKTAIPAKADSINENLGGKQK